MLIKPLPWPGKSLPYVTCFHNILLIFLILFVAVACSPDRKDKAELAYQNYCSSCHIAPKPEELPKHLWEQSVLPEMGARLGIDEPGYNPLENLSLDEQYSILQTGVYPSTRLIDPDDWELLKRYILTHAPDSLPATQGEVPVEALTQFLPRTIKLDSLPGTLISYLGLSENNSKLITGEVSGKLAAYDFASGETEVMGRFGKGITAVTGSGNDLFITAAGYLDPSEIASGRIFWRSEDGVKVLPEILHRPVHTLAHDFNGDEKEELVICEFGDIRGSLSLFTMNQTGEFEKKVLLQQPGAIRTLVRDMDADGKADILVLTGQGDEGVTILYQEENLGFRPEKVLRFSPVYGTSWFEVLDYDGDGDFDIITVNGDNADKTFVPKPYHGLRIHLNDGQGNFNEAYFFPLNGATRFIASDFDQDGDVDFFVLSTFPLYDKSPVVSLVYLENGNSMAFDFHPFTLDTSALGCYFLMDAGDIDHDGDEDLVLSSFTYYFSPVPEDLKKAWLRGNNDILILENRHIKTTK